MTKDLVQKLRRVPFLTLVVLGVIVLFSALRLNLYGNPRLSISGNDTESYVVSSRAPLFSSEMMTGRRLLSTNLIYKLMEPDEGYHITINGSLSTVKRGYQPGFDDLTLFQVILSLVGWGVLAYIIAERLKHPLTKILSAILVLLFAYTPQMADWDSILMSESLTFSLFALQLALGIRMAFALYEEPAANITKWFLIWIPVFFLWVFLRDTNLFTALVLIGMTGMLLLTHRFKKNKYLIGTLVVSGAIFILGFVTSSQSVRSHVQIINIYKDDLLASPLRTSILQEWGMPKPNTPEYREWFKENASKTLLRFMVTHPGYPLGKILNDFPMAFTEIKQTYFKAPELEPSRTALTHIGDALHPENTTPFLATVLFLVGLLISAKQTDDSRRAWAWLMLTLFLIASVAMIPTILGDTWAINRHALFSTMIYRLGMWLSAVILMDLVLEQNSRNIDPIPKVRA